MRRRIIIGFYAIIVFCLISACSLKSLNTETDDGPAQEQDDEYVIDEVVIWGGIYNDLPGVHLSDLAAGKISTLFEADFIGLDIAAGADSFLLTLDDETTSFVMRDGSRTQTEATASAFLSPNGRRIIYSKEGDLRQCAVSSAGSELIAKSATRGSYDAAMNQIAYSTQEGLFIRNTQSGEARHIYLSFAGQFETAGDDPGLMPAFSPDGLLVAAPMVVWENGGKGIRTYVYEIEKNLELTWIGGARFPIWSGDSRMLAYDSDSRIYIWDLDEEVANRQVVYTESTMPRFSPGDDFLLFVEGDLDDGNLSVQDLNVNIPTPVIENSDSPITGHDWMREPYCADANAAPAVSGIEILVDDIAQEAPVDVPEDSEVKVRLTISDADCNLAHGIAFCRHGGESRAIQFDFPNASCETFTEEITLPDAYEGQIDLSFSVEDDCGAGGEGQAVGFYFHSGAD